MKNVITYLKTLWRRGLGSQSSDVSLDCRLTVGSPSVKCGSTLMRLVAISAFLLTIGVGNAWGVVNGDLFERISAAPAANDEVIFVNQAETYACGTTQNKNNRTPVAITTSSNQYIYNSSNNVQVFVVKINSSSKYGFHTGSGYIYSGSSSDNHLKTNSTAASTAPSGTSAWSMNCSSNVWSVTNVTNTSYYLAFNGTTYFSQYKTGQSKPYIYKKVMSAPTAVAASSITTNSATITITDATNVNYYELYYGTSSTAPTASSTATTTIENGKSKSITGLTAGTNYYVWARAYSTSPARKTGWVALTGNYFTTSSASCGVNPTAGSASLNGSISLSSFPVQTTGWTVGANCAWSDFGFVWSSTVSTPTLAANGTASSGCTKIQKATSGTSTNTTHSITGSFETGTTYYVRGYGKNGYASGTYQYTDVLTITPRSVEFNSNGGSAVDTKYVNSGTKVTAPSDPTKTGYNFGEWQLNSSEFDFANTNVTSNITLVATWTAKQCTVNFDIEGGTGTITSVTATYGQAMPSKGSNLPTKTGYDFGGFWDGDGGTGTQYYNADGTSKINWNKDVTAAQTLYAKWTIKSYSVTWKVDGTNYSAGGSTSVNHGSHVSTLPTPPSPASYCGDKFMGWTTDEVYVHNTSPLFTTADSAPTASDAQIFYAVFADYDE